MAALAKKLNVPPGNSAWIIILILSAIVLRLFSFFPSELDHDESTYAIIGNELLKGKMLYADVTDTKPAGIFLVYAGLQFLFGYSIFMKRLFAAVLVGLTGFLIRQVALKVFNNQKAANASSIVYVFYTSMWVYFGLSPNTELYFNFFTIASLLFFLKKGNLNFLIGGLMAGIGFMFKYLVLFDYAAFMLFFLVFEIYKQKKEFRFRQFIPFLLSGFAFLIPFASTALFFYLKGHFNDFYFITFELPGLYKEVSSPLDYLIMIADLLFRFFPITFFFTYVFVKEWRLLKNEYWFFFGLWIFMVEIAMYLPGKGFSHYAIQLMLPLSLLAGLFFHNEVKLGRTLNFIFRGKTGVYFLIGVVMIIETAAFVDNVKEPDSFKQVAHYLQENTTSDDLVFVSNYEPVIYYLMQRETPTKWVHANLLFTDLHKAFQFDNLEEIRRIMNQHPKFVTVQYKSEIMDEMMGTDYSLDRTFRNGEILVYRRKE